MGLETGSHIDDLVTTNPASGDARSQGDDHIRLIKTVLTTDFPAITGPVTATQAELNTLDGITTNVTELNLLDGLTATAAELNTLDGITTNVTELNLLDGLTANATELNRMDGITATTTELNYTDGVTSAIQTQLNTKAPTASPALTGNPTAPTQSPGNDSTRIATTAFVQEAALTAALPSQTGNAGKYLQTDGSTASWQGIDLTYESKTADYTIDSDDKGKIIALTGSSNRTFSFSAAATLGAGWSCYVRNESTSAYIVVNPNGSEQIDGLTGYNMYPGEVRLIQCDGSEFRTIILQAFYREYTSSTAWTKPPGYIAFGGFVWGAGAGGTQGSSPTGGGGGGCAPFTIRASDISSGSTTITIGSGGAGGASPGAGGDSTFGAYITGGGGTAGAGGSMNNILTSSGRDGVGFEGVSAVTGADGLNSIYGGAGGGGGASGSGNAGGDSVWGGAGGGGRGSGAGGTSTFGGNGGANGGTTGANGTAPAGGGGGGSTTAGDGARGEIHIFGIV